MPKIDLLPCPFCGSSRIGVYSKGKYVGMYFPLDNPKYYETYSARCNKCHARGSVCGGIVLGIGAQSPPSPPSEFTTREKLKAMAIAAWNTRASGWISCSERMPDEDSYKWAVGITSTGRCIAFQEHNAYENDTGGISVPTYLAHGSEITHWMPLPEPPGGDDNARDSVQRKVLEL